MTEILNKLLGWFDLTSRWELLAVALAVAYVILAMRKNITCWLAGFASSAIYVALMFERHLYMEAVLNGFYVVMSVYGYWAWRHGRNEAGDMKIERWNMNQHALTIAVIVTVAAVNAWLLTRYTDAVQPYVDSMIFWSSVVTTWMVARRVLENWLYWIVIDAVAAMLYFQQNREPTGVLFLFYVGISVQGYRSWLRDSHNSGKLAADT